MNYLIIILSFISFVLSVFLGFKAFSNETMEKVYIDYIYYILIVNILLWLSAILKTRKKSLLVEFKDYLSNHKIAIIIAFVVVVSGSIICKPDYRILADETNLLSMSQALYENRECKNYTSILYYYYGFKNIIRAELDKRPALFPLTVCFLHTFTGYRPENIFITNIITAFFTLLIFYHLINYRFGKFWGVNSMLLLASYPLFVLYYNSGGFEVFNLLFSLILFWLLLKFIKEPTAINTEVLLLFLPLISQTRYESIVAVVCVLPAILIKLPLSEYFKFSYRLVITPLFFIPIVWLRLLTDNTRGLQAEDKEAAFSYKLFKENLEKAVPFFCGKDFSYGIVQILTYIAIIGAIWAIIDFFIEFFMEFIRKKRTTNKGLSTVAEYDSEDLKGSFGYQKKFNLDNVVKIINKIAFVSVAVLFYLFFSVIRFAYWGGDLPLRSQSRLAIIFLPIFVYFSIYLFSNISSKFKIKRGYFTLFILSLLFVYWPVAGQNLGVRDLTLYREFRATREFLANSFPNKNEFILVVNRANMYTPLKYNSLDFDYFINNQRSVKNNLTNRTYYYLIIAQIVDKSTNRPVSKCRIPNNLKLQKLFETQIRADQYLRFSKCESIE